jgi:phosphopantetheine--protein transferase-like protein
MKLLSFSGYVRCSFNSDIKGPVNDTLSSAEAFFGLTKDFSKEFSSISGFINRDDQIKAARQHNSEDKRTILICYTLLRRILSRRLNIKPEEVTYIISEKGKPGIQQDKLNFNISHTRDAFAFAISESAPIGIDLEKVNKNISFEPIVKRFFSQEEAGFIFSSEIKSRELFFLLWTRKEALLKSFGTGILPYISNIDVFRPVNILEKNQNEELMDISLANHYYIYSRKLEEYFLSVALTEKAEIILNRISGEDLNTLIQ